MEIKTDAQRNIRQAVRNLLINATYSELQTELQISKDHNDSFRADCVRELIHEFNNPLEG